MGEIFSGKNEKCVQKMNIWLDSFKMPELGLEGTEQSLNVAVLVLKETSSSPSPNPHYITEGGSELLDKHSHLANSYMQPSGGLQSTSIPY
jgi:hypothetical protein